MDTIKNKVLELPKADVHSHLHLAGSQKRFRATYPNVQVHFPQKYKGLSGMIDFIYGTLNKVMLTKEDVIKFMDIAIQSAIDDNVIYLEASVDVGLARFFGDSIDALIDTVKILKEKYKAKINFKPDIGVNKDLDLDKVYSDGVKCIESKVFNGIDLYGQELGKDLKPFVRFYDIAKNLGLKTKVHIGEFSDSHSINDAIKLLNPHELQHGIRSADSNYTMDLILERDIRLNVCPTSNIMLGASKGLESYSIRRLYDHGVKLTVNTDDLILFNATISDEYIKLINSNVFSYDEILELKSNAFSD